jgi:hypothetical protein
LAFFLKDNGIEIQLAFVFLLSSGEVAVKVSLLGRFRGTLILINIKKDNKKCQQSQSQQLW